MIRILFLSILFTIQCSISLSPIQDEGANRSFSLHSPDSTLDWRGSKFYAEEIPARIPGFLASRIWKVPRYPSNFPLYYHYYVKNEVIVQERYLVIPEKGFLEFNIPGRLNHQLIFDNPKFIMGDWVLECNGISIADSQSYQGRDQDNPLQEQKDTIQCGEAPNSRLILKNTGMGVAFVPGIYIVKKESHYHELNPPLISPNVIWIVIDSLRYDAIGKYNVTTNIESLYPSMLVFHKHLVNSSWTRPSTTAFLTGRYPSQFSLNFWDYPLHPREIESFHEDENFPLPVLLERLGYKSVFIGNNPFLTPIRKIGADFGFSTILDHSDITDDTHRITDLTIQYCGKNLRNKNSQSSSNLKKKYGNHFLFINYNDPHKPYEPKDEFRRMVQVPLKERGMDPRKMDYLGEVAYVDSELGRLIEYFKSRGLWDDSLVIITSDHGEVMNPAHSRSLTLGNYTLYGHGQGLYEEDIHVPLLIKFPRDSELSKFHGESRHSLTRSIDLFPTILKELGIPQSGEDVPGRALQSVVDGSEKADREYYGETRGTQSYRIGNHKIIRKSYRFHRVGDLWSGAIGEEKDYYFQLEEDQEETHPLKIPVSLSDLGKGPLPVLQRKLEEASPPISFYGIRLNDLPENSQEEWSVEIVLPVGTIRPVAGRRFFPSIENHGGMFHAKIPVQKEGSFEIYFQVYPDIANPSFRFWKGKKALESKNWGAGSFDLNPISCKISECEELFLAQDGVPPPVREMRLQVWKQGRRSAGIIARKDLGESAKEALKRQGYIQ